MPYESERHAVAGVGIVFDTAFSVPGRTRRHGVLRRRALNTVRIGIQARRANGRHAVFTAPAGDACPVSVPGACGAFGSDPGQGLRGWVILAHTGAAAEAGGMG